MTNQEASKIIKDGIEDMSLDYIDIEQYEALTMAIKALQEPSGDLISRQAVFEQINCWIGSGEYRYTNATHYLTERVKHIPSVKQERTGHWIKGMSWKCDQCHYEDDRALGTPFCPKCGARMVEQKESEE